MTARALMKTAVFGAAISAIGVALKRWLERHPAEIRSAGEGAGVREGEGAVRNAGPEATRTAPSRKWQKEDQASDESFPASDPPGQGVG